MIGEITKVLEVKEPYTVKTELLKNSTHQSYKWVEIAFSNDKQSLEKWANDHIDVSQEWRIKDRY